MQFVNARLTVKSRPRLLLFPIVFGSFCKKYSANRSKNLHSSSHKYYLKIFHEVFSILKKGSVSHPSFTLESPTAAPPPFLCFESLNFRALTGEDRARLSPVSSPFLLFSVPPTSTSPTWATSTRPRVSRPRDSTAAARSPNSPARFAAAAHFHFAHFTRASELAPPPPPPLHKKGKKKFKIWNYYGLVKRRVFSRHAAGRRRRRVFPRLTTAGRRRRTSPSPSPPPTRLLLSRSPPTPEPKDHTWAPTFYQRGGRIPQNLYPPKWL